ncbi:MAG: HIT family protein [Bacteroidetes bacterium]|nr:HIT family protein [Bacteroidota bacterium]
MSGIFSKIISGEIPSHKVAETEHFLAFLDIMPLKRGHVLVIPKKETDYFFDLDEEELSGLMKFSKTVATAMKKAIPCRKIGITVIGLEVPHAHVHLIPIDHVDDMNFAKPKLKPDAAELEQIAAEIRAHFIY